MCVCWFILSLFSSLSDTLVPLLTWPVVSSSARNWFRATLLLVPLLGMQYVLTPFKPEPGHRWEIVYEVVSAFTTSFQVCRDAWWWKKELNWKFNWNVCDLNESIAIHQHSCISCMNHGSNQVNWYLDKNTLNCTIWMNDAGFEGYFCAMKFHPNSWTSNIERRRCKR